MKTWLWLAAAIVLEVSGTLALRATIDHPAWIALVVVGYVGSFAALTVLLRAGAPVGVVYGIWAACGVALTAVLAAAIYGDTLSSITVVGIVVVIAGVLLIEIGSQGAARRQHDGEEEEQPCVGLSSS